MSRSCDAWKIPSEVISKIAKARFRCIIVECSYNNSTCPAFGFFVKDLQIRMLPPFFICLVSLILHHACATCNVEMISREEWGAREPRSAETMNMPVPHIFIHHTVTRACSSLESCSRTMRSMQNYHMDDKGWDDIGYNFVIGGDGRVYIGRGWNRVGAHTYGFNRNAVAFSLIGDYTNYAPPENMLMTTKKMIQCAKNESYVTDDFKIHGHRDGTCTECPGQALYDIIKTWENFQGGPLPGYSCKRS